MNACLYLAFLVSIIFGGSIYFGPASPRQYMTVLVFSYLLLHSEKVKKYWDKYLSLYLLFALFYGLSSYMEGALGDFIREFISRYMVCIVGYIATRCYLENKNNYRHIIIVILCCGVLNSLVTLLQYFRYPIGMAIGALFVDMDNLLEYYRFQHMADGDAGTTYFGMMSNGVFNGYFTMILPILVIYFLYEERSKGTPNAFKEITCWGLWGLFILCSFIIQERGPFLIAVMVTAYIMLRESKYKIALLSAVVIVFLFVIPSLLDSNLWRESRLAAGSDLSNDSRVRIYSLAMDFIVTHPLFGGIRTVTSIIGNMPHNFFINAFIYGGIIGGVIILYIIYVQLRRSFILVHKNLSLMMPLSLIAYTLNGLTHNPSIITGEVLMWMMWGCVQFDYYKHAGYKLKVKI